MANGTGPSITGYIGHDLADQFRAKYNKRDGSEALRRAVEWLLSGEDSTNQTHPAGHGQHGLIGIISDFREFDFSHLFELPPISTGHSA